MAPTLARLVLTFKARRILITTKLGANFEFVERFCKWSKTAIILMFISPVALFILLLKFRFDHLRGEKDLSCRWTNDYVKILELN
jgi:hypothetical protein